MARWSETNAEAERLSDIMAGAAAMIFEKVAISMKDGSCLQKYLLGVEIDSQSKGNRSKGVVLVGDEKGEIELDALEIESISRLDIL